MVKTPLLRSWQLGALWFWSTSLCESIQETNNKESNFTSTSAATPPADGDKLKLVQCVFRHGARTPLTSLYWHQNGQVGFEKGTVCGELLQDKVDITITDGRTGGPQPFAAHDAQQAAKVLPGGCTKGELTLLGQQQALQFGHFLRRRYIDAFKFLPAVHQPGTVTGRTTNFRRTIGTLEYAVSGLYPSSQQPIPITTASELDEILYANVRSCEQLAALMRAQRKAVAEERREVENVGELERRVHSAMGTPLHEPVSFIELHDALTTLRFHDKQLPGKFSPELLKDIEREATHRMLGIVAPSEDAEGRPGLLRLGVGRLAHEISERMASAIAGTNSHKLYLYSGHDTTIMPLLRALGVEVEHWPGYVSNLVFELWERPVPGGKQAAQHVVRVLYNGHLLRLPGTDADGTISLAALQQGTWGYNTLHSDKHTELCRIQLQHESTTPKAAESGDVVQGL